MKKRLIAFLLLSIPVFLLGCIGISSTIPVITIDPTTGSNTISETVSPTTIASTSISTWVPTDSQTIIDSTYLQPTTVVPTTNQPTTIVPTTVETMTTLPTTLMPSTIPPTTGITTTIIYERFETLEFYSLNDFHGGAYSDMYTIAAIGSFMHQRKLNQGAILLASGDIFQGSALSNYYFGLPLVEAMNIIGFDAFTIGNHEFDWGLDKIDVYWDGLSGNGEADYPILAANLVDKQTGETLPWTQPYIIITYKDIRIGIIGVIDDYTYNSISYSRVADYEFLDEVSVIYDYAAHLRNEENCDIIIASIHGYDTYANRDIAYFQGAHLVDAIFNGHTHSDVASSVSRTGFAPLYYAQASNYSSSLFAGISLEFDRQTRTVVSGSASTYSENDIASYGNHQSVLTMLDIFVDDDEYQDYITTYLTTATQYFSKSSLTPWGSSVIRDYVGVDFGVMNNGGFRINMNSGDLTMGDLVVIYPFDNYIKKTKMTGQQITNLYRDKEQYGWDLVFDQGVTYSAGILFKDGISVNLDQYYWIASVDYAFDRVYTKSNNVKVQPFSVGIETETTTFLIRDLLVEDLINSNGSFNPAYGTHYPPVDVFVIFDRKKEEMMI